MLTGCAIGLEKTADPDTAAESLGNNVLVFGRLRWIENGALRDVYKKGGLGWNIYPMILNMSSMEKRTLPVEPDGRFYWILPKGTYMLYRLSWFDPIDGQHRLESKIAFQAVGENQGYYLGVLEIKIEGKRDFLGGLWIKSVAAQIRDEAEQDVLAFRERHSDTNLTLAKSLMVIDDRLPKDPKLEQKAKLAELLQSISFGLLMTIQY